KRVNLPVEGGTEDVSSDAQAGTMQLGDGTLVSRLPAPESEGGGQINKPDVNWELRESQPSPLARTMGREEAPAPRKTPEIELKEESPQAPLPQGAPLPVEEKPEEPAAPLRPAGTTPPAFPAGEGVESAQREANSGTRAVPVVASE
ncbi:MAG: hypothetical protein AAF491_03535, partial [Verrucomicrobiota bacterium]